MENIKYRYLISSRAKDNILKKILDMVYNMGGMEAAVNAIKNLKKKTASIRQDLKTKLLIRLLCLYTGWTSQAVMMDPQEAIMKALSKGSSRNEYQKQKRKK